jgi:hypothetical protein
MPSYPGTGQATLLNCNTQKFFWSKERIPVGGTSVAFELHRVRGNFYPWGAAIEVSFTGSPGAFEVDIQGAETDQDSNYVNLSNAVISVVNGNYVGRYDLMNVYPKFVRLRINALTNDVNITAKITR